MGTRKARRPAWRLHNVGRLLNNATRRFEGRVLELMATSGYAGTRIAHVSLTRNLDLEGTRVSELARRASMSKQAMAELVEQCEALDLVERTADPLDGRARIVRFTAFGLEWLDAFRTAVDSAEQEMQTELGATLMADFLQALRSYGGRANALERPEDE